MMYECAQDVVAVDVPTPAPPPPYVQQYERGYAVGRLLHNPLVRLLGWALALALVPAVAALNVVWDTVVNAAGYACRGEWCMLLKDLLLVLPFKALVLVPVAMLRVCRVQWPHMLDDPEWCPFPWLRPLLFVLPVWRSPTTKARAFAGAGDAGVARRLLGAARGTGAAAEKRRLGQQLRRGVDGWRGGAGDDAGCLAVVARLLAAGADVDAVDSEGKSALHRMCFYGFPRAAKPLLEGGANPNLRDSHGYTPLHWAAMYNKPATMALLLAHGADPNFLDNKGRSPLMAVGTGVGESTTGAKAEAARKPLRPAPAWGDLRRALAAAANGAGAARAVLALLPLARGLRALQLFDLLWVNTLEPSGAARVERRVLIFEQLIAPLVREAPARKLEPEEKALLIRACEATAWRRRGDQRAARRGYREEYDALLRETMASFAAQLTAEHAALAAQPGGAALLALPATEMLNGAAKGALSQDDAAAAGPAPWLDAGGIAWSFFGFSRDWRSFCSSFKPQRLVDGDLAGAIRCALGPLGALACAEDVCELLQGGRHRLLKEARITHFKHYVAPWRFWLHVCALASVARHEPLNAEFHAHIKAMLDGVAGAVFKDAALKGYDRVAVKAAEYHGEMGLPQTPAGAGEAAARVVDIVRCSFEVPTAQAALALVARLDAATLVQHGVVALRRKNGFHPDAPSAGGYRDIKYNLLYQSAKVPGALGRAVVEVQIIVAAYLKVKKKMHAVYRVDRGDFG